MGPTVVLGQDLSEGAGPVGDGAVADLAAGEWKLGYGHRDGFVNLISECYGHREAAGR